MGARGLLQIGEVAARTGLSLRTIRWYEEVGLLPPAERSPGGFRLYPDSTVARLQVVAQTRPLDLSLDQTREVLDALDAGPERSAEQRDVLSGYAALTQERVAALRGRLADAEAFCAALTNELGR